MPGMGGKQDFMVHIPDRHVSLPRSRCCDPPSIRRTSYIAYRTAALLRNRLVLIREPVGGDRSAIESLNPLYASLRTNQQQMLPIWQPGYPSTPHCGREGTQEFAGASIPELNLGIKARNEVCSIRRPCHSQQRGCQHTYPPSAQTAPKPHPEISSCRFHQCDHDKGKRLFWSLPKETKDANRLLKELFTVLENLRETLFDTLLERSFPFKSSLIHDVFASLEIVGKGR